MKKERFFEYLMTLVKQSHQHVDKTIQYFFYENLPEILKKMRFDNDYEQFYYIERNKLDSLLPEIGKYLRKLIKNVEHSGCTNLSFKILQKVYQNSFEENNGQMKLKKNYSW
jgi:heme oxygenase